MTTVATPTEVFHALADGVPRLVLGDRSQLDQLVALYAEHTDTDAFDIPCISVLRVRDGQIVESRDYTDAVGFARAFGRLDELAAALAA
ncbi:hypothetical protein [Frankia tisae]|uniref:hypothetical protein n=1 Tax=Frankia tisae TaxID=2950104 RepID=UPI0021C10A95|nr:hypothetical protein [Frankia tisae]